MPMTATRKPKLTFQEYIRYDDDTDNRYELEDGELNLIPIPTVRHALINSLLGHAIDMEISRLQLPWACLTSIGIRTGVNWVRIPDLCVVTEEEILAKLDQAAIIDWALVAVEIVSAESSDRDYRFKRSEYSAVGIPEYWIIDPTEGKVSVLSLVDVIKRQNTKAAIELFLGHFLNYN